MVMVDVTGNSLYWRTYGRS